MQYFGEIDGDRGNRQKTAEPIAGRCALELPGLSALYQFASNEAKAFMNRQQEDGRMVCVGHNQRREVPVGKQLGEIEICQGDPKLSSEPDRNELSY
ncbi:hypothetical protein [uncultured Sulfitobacter sp.]|uniref:hypothetical protein n=1 Tax=Sulfitobacter sp. SH22 TaxID=3421172 RepID=UPI0025E38428|nr:hypothetical protein [uncultured Sulfitobacter sp.]